MKPPKDAERIIGDVWSLVSFDRGRLRTEVGERFTAGSTWNDLIEAERIAEEVVQEDWDEVALDCDRALADVHERYLVQAARALEAQQDLRQNTSESWIARAVTHAEAGAIAWDVLDERGLLTELPE